MTGFTVFQPYLNRKQFKLGNGMSSRLNQPSNNIWSVRPSSGTERKERVEEIKSTFIDAASTAGFLTNHKPN